MNNYDKAIELLELYSKLDSINEYSYNDTLNECVNILNDNSELLNGSINNKYTWLLDTLLLSYICLDFIL